MKKQLYFCFINYLFVLGGFAAADESPSMRRRRVSQSSARSIRTGSACGQLEQNEQYSYSPNFGQEGGVEYLERFRGYVYTQFLNPVSMQKKND